MAELFVEAASLILLAVLAWRGEVRFGGCPGLIALLVILLPVLQLIPLPPGTWSALPGRESAVQTLELVGQQPGWRPLTLDPEATWRSMLALIPGVALFIATLNLPASYRSRLALIAVGFAVAGAVLGALQVAGGRGWAIVESAHSGFGTGLFSNRNHQAAFLAIAMLLAAALARIGEVERIRITRPIAAGTILLLAAGVLATTSRAGAMMLAVALPLSLFPVFAPRLSFTAAAGAGAMVAATATVAYLSPAGQLVRERIGGHPDDLRLLFWQDIPVAIQSYWPWGSGFGTFPTVFQAVERLDNVGAGFVNNAHNDYLELAVEGGLPVLLAIVAGLALLTMAAWRQTRAGDRRDKVLAQAAVAAIVLLLLHSIVDYPLRMPALAALFGMLAGLLFVPAAGPPTPHWVRGLALSAAAALLLGKAAAIHLAGEAVLRDRVALAEALVPYSPTAATFVAVEALRWGQPRKVEAAAVAALRQAPVRPEPLALLGIARQAAGRKAEARAIMKMVGARSWREAVASLWLLSDGVMSGNAAMAAQRGDALLRQNLFANEVLAAFRQLAADPAGREALADRLAADPHWRRRFLTSNEGLDSEAHQALLLAVAKRGAPITEDEAAALVRRLLADQRPRDAYRAWQQFAHSGGFVSDPRFERLVERGDRAPPVPFEWRLTPLLGASVSTQEAERGDGAELRISSGAGIVGHVAEQMLVLMPGSYVLTAKFTQNAPALRFTVECSGGRDRHLQTAAKPLAKSGTARSTFLVPAACPTQKLAIAVTGDSDIDASISTVGIVAAR